ncbi:hypothetical protein N7513_004204 [Penicillium frequentans]|nr:hypothetical protein N7513_004204 [Penicillium glabrum]
MHSFSETDSCSDQRWEWHPGKSRGPRIYKGSHFHPSSPTITIFHHSTTPITSNLKTFNRTFRVTFYSKWVPITLAAAALLASALPAHASAPNKSLVFPSRRASLDRRL